MEQTNKYDYKYESNGCFAWLCCRKKKSEIRPNRRGQYKPRTADNDDVIGDDGNVWSDNDNTIEFSSIKSKNDDYRTVINDFDNHNMENHFKNYENCHKNEKSPSYDKDDRYDNSHTSNAYHCVSHSKDRSSTGYQHSSSHTNDHSSNNYHHGSSYANDHSSSNHHRDSSHTNDHSNSGNDHSYSGGGDDYGGGDCGGGGGGGCDD